MWPFGRSSAGASGVSRGEIDRWGLCDHLLCDAVVVGGGTGANGCQWNGFDRRGPRGRWGDKAGYDREYRTHWR